MGFSNYQANGMATQSMSGGHSRQEAWDDYWRSGAISVCLSGEDGNYAGAVREFWRQFFADCASGSRILDMACGNGALALIAAEAVQAGQGPLHVTGVDSARIQKLKALDENEGFSCELHGNTAAERMPFPDASFDRIISQFGIEYSDTGKSLAEAVRVLVPGGSLNFLVHARSSEVVARARCELDTLAALVDSIALPDHVGELIKAEAAFQQLPTQRLKHALAVAKRKAQHALNHAARLAKTAPGNLVSQTLDMVRNLHQGRTTHGYRWSLGQAEFVKSALLANRGRLQAMARAALSAQDLQAWRDRLAELGLQDVSGEAFFQEPGAILGYLVKGNKPT